MPPYPRWLVPALILALGALIGTNTALAKGLVVGGIAPLSLLLWHQAGAAVVLLAALAWRGEAFPWTPRVLGYSALLGLCSLTLPSAIGFHAMPHIGAGTYTAMFTLSPLCTFALRWAVDRAYPGHRRLLGLAVGGLGAASLVVAGLQLAPGAGGWLALALVTPLLLATGNLVRERLMPPDVSRLQLSVAQPVAQLAMLVPVAVASGTPMALPLPPLTGEDAVLAAQVAIAVAIYPLFFQLQARADAVALSQIGYVTVAAGVLWGAALYGESLSPWMAVALVLLLAGLQLVQSASRAEPAPPAAADAARPSP